MPTPTLVKPNPVLERGFETARPVASDSTETMSINGAVHATGVFLFVLVAMAAVGWRIDNMAVAIVGVIGALIAGFYTNFRPMHAQYGGLAYAVLEGLAVGTISKVYEDTYDGIVLQAAGVTIAILTALLLVYRTGVIEVTQNFRLAVSAGVLGIFLLYMVDIVMGLFGGNISLINSSSNFGIIFSLFVVVLACATLVVDFDFIERGVEERLPRQMNWFAAFGLMVSIVWLYLEVLRLLAKLQRR